MTYSHMLFVNIFYQKYPKSRQHSSFKPPKCGTVHSNRADETGVISARRSG